MNPFIIEALTIGLKEGIKLGLVWLVFSSFLFRKGRPELLMPFYIGLGIASFFVLLSFFIPAGPYARDLIAKLIGYVFFLFFFSAVLALYQTSGVNLFGPLKGIAGRRIFLAALILFSTVVYFAPDIIGSSMYLGEIALMKGGYAWTYLSALFGFAVSLMSFLLLIGRLGGLVSRFFGIAQFLLFLSVIKLLGGGIKGFAELSLLPSVQRGVMKFVHDFVHQVFVFFMVPDHPLLKMTVWNFIGFFFGGNFALMVVLALLLLPPAMFLYHSLLGPIPEPEGALTGAEKRLIKAGVKSERRMKALPPFIFVLVILLSWFSGRGGEVSRLYNPKPVPVVEDKGTIIIPLTDPTMDLMDGRIHKFAFHSAGETITLLITKKPDGRLAVCLDACEICPPEGYGQTEGHVVCIYCMTPIPVETLGKPGGCNPIPVKAEVGDKDVRIDVSDVLLKWKAVKSGATREGIR
jgi:uncharacterized membrane protein